MDKVVSVQSSRQPLDSFALLSGVLAPVTWGLTGIFVHLLHGIPTLAIVVGRMLIAALVLIPWALRRRGGMMDAVLSPLAIAMGAYYIFATEAFARAPVVEVTLLIGAAPVIAVGLERLRGVRPVRQQLTGAIVSVVGLVLFLRPGDSLSTERAVGYVFALGAAAASATYAVGLRARAQSHRPLDPLALTVWACVLGAVVSFLLLSRSMLISAPPIPSSRQFIYLVLLGCVSTAIPTLAFGVASARLPSVLTTSLGLMTPLFAALFAGFIVNEWPAPATLPGAFIAIAGVVIVLRSPVRL
jgi:DME family drug/metabolite transporter